MALGGKREGAGRKKARHTIQAEEARKFVINEIAKDLQPILTAQKDVALGLYYEKIDSGGKIRVYRKEPEARTGEYLLNQIIGKPKETLDVGIHKDIDADF